MFQLNYNEGITPQQAENAKNACCGVLFDVTASVIGEKCGLSGLHLRGGGEQIWGHPRDRPSLALHIPGMYIKTAL